MGISQSLRGHPILAVGAVEIASHHTEAVSESAGVRVKERLLLDGIALRAGGVSPRNVELASAIEADFADAGLPFGDRTTMSAGETADAVVAESLDERGFGFANTYVENFTEGGHGYVGASLLYFIA